MINLRGLTSDEVEISQEGGLTVINTPSHTFALSTYLDVTTLWVGAIPNRPSDVYTPDVAPPRGEIAEHIRDEDLVLVQEFRLRKGYHGDRTIQ